jgi:hypothetical protein
MTEKRKKTLHGFVAIYELINSVKAGAKVRANVDQRQEHTISDEVNK